MNDAPETRANPAVRRRASDGYGRTEPPRRPWLARAGIAAVRALGSFPLATAHRLGTAVGFLLGALPTPARRITEINLGIAFPEMDGARRRALARRSLIEESRTFAEVGAWWTWDAASILRRIGEVHGEDHLAGPLARGQGVILAAPHLGSWEMLGAYCSMRYPMTTLYRAPRLREMDAFFRDSRRRFGATLVPADLGAARALLVALRRGDLVGMLPDQDSGTGAGVFVPFFGATANTMTLLSKLAHRSGAPVVLGWAVRDRGGERFTIRFVRAPEAVADADVAVAAAALNGAIERAVRSSPESYLWSYRRYRIRPPGRPSPYDHP